MKDESKAPDTWQVDETSFNEGFDFGEGETQSHPMQTTTTNGRNKKIICLIFVIVMLIMVYSFKLLNSKNPPNTATLTTKSASTVTTNPRHMPENINETPEEVKKQPDEFTGAFSNVTPSAAAVSTPVSAEPKPVTVSVSTPVPLPAATPIPAALSISEAEKNRLLEEAQMTHLARLDKLNNQIASILGQIKYLDVYSREVSVNLNKLNGSISTINNRLLALIDTTSTLSKDVGTVKNEMGQVKEILKEGGLDTNTAPLSKGKQACPENEGQIAIAEPEYRVHAVVPGRAWLKSTKGQLVTVTEGDSIGSYGRILIIDAANGVVLTSSGIAFR